ncbi:MAG: hypothetical protein IKA97_05770, partial [Clostridia bacterium]|nr:hypothetical protein [Clostridia bacterium]
IADADALVANASDDGKKDLAAAKAAYAELVARYNAIFSVVEGFDAYIAGTQSVYGKVVEYSGYNFATKAIVDGGAAAIIFDAPIYYVEDIAAAYREIVENYDKLNDAIVSAVADVRTLVATDMATYTKAVASVDVEGIAITTGTGTTILKGLQDYIVAEATAAFEVEKESIAKKGIDEVIARSLKDAVKAVADFVEEFEYPATNP